MLVFNAAFDGEQRAGARFRSETPNPAQPRKMGCAPLSSNPFGKHGAFQSIRGAVATGPAAGRNGAARKRNPDSGARKPADAVQPRRSWGWGEECNRQEKFHAKSELM